MSTEPLDSGLAATAEMDQALALIRDAAQNHIDSADGEPILDPFMFALGREMLAGYSLDESVVLLAAATLLLAQTMRERDQARAEVAKVAGERDDALQVVADLDATGELALHPLTVGSATWRAPADVPEPAQAPEGAEIHTAVLTWDYRQQPDLAELARQVTTLSGGRLHLTAVEDTGTDECAIVISDKPIDPWVAVQVYRRRWHGTDQPEATGA